MLNSVGDDLFFGGLAHDRRDRTVKEGLSAVRIAGAKMFDGLFDESLDVARKTNVLDIVGKKNLRLPRV